MVPVALALGASIAWGCSDFLAGLKTRRLAVLWVLVVSQGTGLALVLVAALVSAHALPGGHAALLAAGAGVAELIGFAALYRALAVGAMSVVAPVSATAALLPVVVSVATGRAPTAAQALGIAFALTLGMAAIVSVLGSLYPLATVVLARAVLHEHVTGSQRAGVVAALAGIGLVSLA